MLSGHKGQNPHQPQKDLLLLLSIQSPVSQHDGAQPGWLPPPALPQPVTQAGGHLKFPWTDSSFSEPSGLTKTSASIWASHQTPPPYATLPPVRPANQVIPLLSTLQQLHQMIKLCQVRNRLGAYFYEQNLGPHPPMWFRGGSSSGTFPSAQTWGVKSKASIAQKQPMGRLAPGELSGWSLPSTSRGEFHFHLKLSTPFPIYLLYIFWGKTFPPSPVL